MAIYIGDGVLTFKNDFRNKIAGSMKECNLEIYEQNINKETLYSNIPLPTDNSWVKLTSQEEINLLKNKNNIPLVKKCNDYNKNKVLMIEADFTNICHLLFNDDNIAFRNSINISNIDIYMTIQGFDGTRISNNFDIYLFNNFINGWYTNLKSQGNIDITKYVISYDIKYNCAISADNKLYLALFSYNSTYNRILNNEIKLDYLNINLNVQLSPDIINPIPLSI